MISSPRIKTDMFFSGLVLRGYWGPRAISWDEDGICGGLRVGLGL